MDSSSPQVCSPSLFDLFLFLYSFISIILSIIIAFSINCFSQTPNWCYLISFIPFLLLLHMYVYHMLCCCYCNYIVVLVLFDVVMMYVLFATTVLFALWQNQVVRNQYGCFEICSSKTFSVLCVERAWDDEEKEWKRENRKLLLLSRD